MVVTHLLASHVAWPLLAESSADKRQSALVNFAISSIAQLTMEDGHSWPSPSSSSTPSSSNTRVVVEHTVVVEQLGQECPSYGRRMATLGRHRRRCRRRRRIHGSSSNNSHQECPSYGFDECPSYSRASRSSRRFWRLDAAAARSRSSSDSYSKPGTAVGRPSSFKAT